MSKSSPELSVRDCCLFVSEIESPFIRTEIRNLASVFSRVLIFTQEEARMDGFPNNVLAFDTSSSLLQKRESGDLSLAISLLIREFKSPYNSSASRKAWRSHLSQAFNAIKDSRMIAKITAEHQVADPFYYAYWFNNQALSLAILRSKGKIRSFIIRAHGRDLFEFREPGTKRLPFREFVLEQCQRTFTVSKDGADYLKARYPGFNGKISTHYIGSSGIEASRVQTNPPVGILRVASNARIRNIKRIHRIAEILEASGLPCEWWHFGDENLGSATFDSAVVAFQEVKERWKTNDRLELKVMGHKDISEILEIYSTNFFHLFISLSETEGLPVSMMEASSAGIPLLATDAGGCREIVEACWGKIVPVDFSAEETASWVSTAFSLGELSDPSIRLKIRQAWEANFDEQNNFREFCKLMESST